MEAIRLGIHAALLGRAPCPSPGDRGDRFLVETLGAFVEYVPVCPEAEIGLGGPGTVLRLEGDPANPRLVHPGTREDWTERVAGWSRERVRQLEDERLSGFVLKARCPISGMERVFVHGEDGKRRKAGTGVFARILMERLPLLPVEEDGRLHDPGLRENFIERIFVLKRWRESVARDRRRRALVAFHAREKLLLLSHSPRHLTELGRLVAGSKRVPDAELYAGYLKLLMEALRMRSTAKKHANVLQHMLGYFKKQLSADEKQEMLEIIDAYRHGHVPLTVPLTLMAHHVRKYDQAYLREQTYLHPHPVELKLRNHP